MTTSIKEKFPKMTWEYFKYSINELGLATLDVESATLITLLDKLHKEKKISKDFLRLKMIQAKILRRNISMLVPYSNMNLEKDLSEVEKDTVRTLIRQSKECLNSLYKFLEEF